MTTVPPITVLSQGTFLHVETPTFLEAAAAAGFDAVDIWRRVDRALPASVLRKWADELGIVVDAVCRGGFLVQADQGAAFQESLAAIDDAAELGARALVLMAGPVTTTFADAFALAVDAIEVLVPAAQRAGVVLALEPFHPMMAAERSAVVTLRTGLDIVEQFPAETVQLAVDAYHVWWDPELEDQLLRSSGRIASVHVSDWLVPTPDLLRGRGLPREGVIPLGDFLAAVQRAAYAGPIEIEVLNDRFVDVAPIETARLLKASLDELLHSARGVTPTPA